jgi:hypothetical protein
MTIDNFDARLRSRPLGCMGLFHRRRGPASIDRLSRTSLLQLHVMERAAYFHDVSLSPTSRSREAQHDSEALTSIDDMDSTSIKARRDRIKRHKTSFYPGFLWSSSTNYLKPTIPHSTTLPSSHHPTTYKVNSCTRARAIHSKHGHVPLRRRRHSSTSSTSYTCACACTCPRG